MSQPSEAAPIDDQGSPIDRPGALVEGILCDLEADGVVIEVTDAQNTLIRFVISSTTVLTGEEIDALFTLIKQVDDAKCPEILAAWQRAGENGFLKFPRSSCYLARHCYF